MGGYYGDEVSHLVCHRCWTDIFNTKPYRLMLHTTSAQLVYKITRQQIQRSTESGCGWCSFVIDELHEVWQSEKDFEISMRTVDWGSNITPKGCLGLQLAVSYIRDEERQTLYTTVTHVFTKHNDPTSSFVPARPLRKDVKSGAAYEHIASWLKACRAHENCSNLNDRPLPRRVIQVKPIPRILDAHGRHGKYLCLSYCWGKPGKATLTKENYAKCYEALDMTLLSKTAQDAIEVAQGMDVPYLWIDALCIVQDSEKDKAENLSIMSSIYRNSLLTIVAGRASDADQGFLDFSHALHPFSITNTRASSSKFKIPVRCDDENWGTVFVERRQDSEYRENDEPINKRAWTLQEMCLPRKLLIYGSHTLQWRCLEVTQNFDNYVHQGTISGVGDVSMPLPILFASQKAGSIPSRGLSYQPSANIALDRATREKISDYWSSASTFSDEIFGWMRLISSYTQRHSEYPNDKLPAIAGIAEIWQRPPNSIYLAGLWSFSIPWQLMWYGDYIFEIADYRAPSWSWASVNGRIEYFVDIMDDFIGTNVYGLVVRGGSTTTKYNNVPYGEVTHGVLCLHGYLHRCWYDASGRRSDESLLLTGNEAEEASRKCESRDTVDLIRETADEAYSVSAPVMCGNTDREEDHFPRWVYCIPVLDGTWAGLIGLIVVPTGNQYRRIGCFLSGSEKDFEGELQQNVELI